MSARWSSQGQPFAIYCDDADEMPSAESSHRNKYADADREYPDRRADSPMESVASRTITGHDMNLAEQDEDYLPPLHRNITATSVSSLPTSSVSSESEERYNPTRGPRTSTRSSNTKKLQLGYTGPDRLSPYRSFRASSPRKSANVRMSPRPRTRERQDEIDTSYFPLVLLHVTILPVMLPWSQDTMRSTLPKAIKDDIALLKSHVSDMILQRGVLVPHPQEDFELLEDRVLEALDLDLQSSDACEPLGGGNVEEDSQSQADVELAECNFCQTCGEEKCFSNSLRRKWDVRVYAANGLMREGAWAAAWSEMERVDVEVLPYLSHELRVKLDEAQLEECRSRPVSVGASGDTEAAFDQAKKTPDGRLDVPPSITTPTPSSETRPARSIATTKSGSNHQLPPAYKSKDIPLRVLLRNYIYLLAQDRRNVAIVFLLVTVVFSTIQGMVAIKPGPAIDSRGGIDRNYGPPVPGPIFHTNISSAAVNSPHAEPSANKGVGEDGVRPDFIDGRYSTVVDEAVTHEALNADSIDQINVPDLTDVSNAASTLPVSGMADAEACVDGAGTCRVKPSIVDMVCTGEQDGVC